LAHGFEALGPLAGLLGVLAALLVLGGSRGVGEFVESVAGGAALPALSSSTCSRAPKVLPSSVASLMRWASPPESWVLGWPSVR
jgi:hypothetical protein